MLNDGWSFRFLKLAKHISSWSKDPSTKVGSIIVDNNHRIISMGYNGFPTGIPDTEKEYNNRDIKLKKVVHAEANAIIFAKQDLSHCTLYVWPFMPCSNCAGLVIQSGIKKIISVTNDEARWQESFKFTKDMCERANVTLFLYDSSLID